MENNEVVMICLDKPRALRLTNRVLKRFCAGQNISLTDIEKAIQRYDVLTVLMYEMLRADDPELTQERCDELLDMVSIGEIVGACSRAVEAGFTVPKDGNDTDPTGPSRNSAG